MDEVAISFITLGSMFLLGLAADLIGRRTRVPRVSLLVLCGVAFGPAGLDWINVEGSIVFDVVGSIALMMVGFLIGGKLQPRRLLRQGRRVMQLSLGVVVMTIICVALTLGLIGYPWPLVLVLAGIATSTDPIATIDVLEHQAVGDELADTLRAVVAIDDAWGLVAFSLLAGLAVGMNGGADPLAHAAAAAWEIGGAIVLGALLGVPMGLLSGRISAGEPTLVEALGIIFLAGGLAMLLGVSFLLTAMVLGLVVSVVAKHHRRAFHEIEHVEWPLMVLFFILAGAALDFDRMLAAGGVGLGYFLLRIVGRWLGGVLGLWGLERGLVKRGWMGLTLLPQAGIAMGTALLAGQYLPEYHDTIITVAVAAAIAFELVGPPVTALALRRLSRSG